MSLYVAYGSNLNVQQMSYRCPGATVAFTGYLINWKLLYRGSRTGSYATVKRQKGSRVPVAVWNIDSKNEKALDLYEGYPRFYKKRNVFVQLKNGTRKKAMISFTDMISIMFMPPLSQPEAPWLSCRCPLLPQSSVFVGW